jgi:hypothetical protein
MFAIFQVLICIFDTSFRPTERIPSAASTAQMNVLETKKRFYLTLSSTFDYSSYFHSVVLSLCTVTITYTIPSLNAWRLLHSLGWPWTIVRMVGSLRKDSSFVARFDEITPGYDMTRVHECFNSGLGSKLEHWAMVLPLAVFFTPRDSQWFLYRLSKSSLFLHSHRYPGLSLTVSTHKKSNGQLRFPAPSRTGNIS